MKIGIVGLGYWGKIILKNLENMNYENVILCDNSQKNNSDFNKYQIINDYRNLNCDTVFISTPTSTHFEICKYFLKQNTKIFCEKPLTSSSSEAEELYNYAIKNNLILFTDWIFTFNSQIEQMKKDYENGKLGKIHSIFMNRLNFGPERNDINAKWDLAAHDVSIIQYIFSEKPKKVKWTDYKRNKSSKQNDSSLGLIEFENFTACINVSWYYRKKVRECVFEFEKFFVTWDDYRRVLEYEDSNIKFPVYSGNISYPCSEYSSPLVNSIKSFFSFTTEDLIKQKQLTLETIKILEA